MSRVIVVVVTTRNCQADWIVALRAAVVSHYEKSSPALALAVLTALKTGLDEGCVGRERFGFCAGSGITVIRGAKASVIQS